MQPTPVKLDKIGQLSIKVSDIDAAVAFYHDTLGLELLFQMERMAFLDCAGIRLMLSLPEKGQSEQPSSPIYFQVRNVHYAQRQLSAGGVPFEGEPHRIADMGDHELWMTFFRDPDGNLMGLMCEVSKGDAM